MTKVSYILNASLRQPSQHFAISQSKVPHFDLMPSITTVINTSPQNRFLYSCGISFLSIYLSIYISIYLYIYISIYLSIYLSIQVSPGNEVMSMNCHQLDRLALSHRDKRKLGLCDCSEGMVWMKDDSENCAQVCMDKKELEAFAEEILGRD